MGGLGRRTLSPLGPLVAEAAREGYGKKAGSGKSDGKPAAPMKATVTGYCDAQGKDAPGGTYSYLVRNKIDGGFASSPILP